MSHRVHPKVFRLTQATDWNSRWFSKKNLPKYLEEDFKIRKFLTEKLKEAGIQKIEIERFPGRTTIIINTSRPGLIIGRGGTGVEDLRKKLDSISSSGGSDGKRKIELEVREIKNPWIESVLVAQWVAQQLEKRMPFRRTLKQSLDKIMANKEIQGSRVEVSGRLDGKEIARREWLKRGCLPRQTIRAIIDYGTAEAHCAYGVIGIKVWLYKGERFE